MSRAGNNRGMLRPDQVEDAISFGVARLSNTPLEQLQMEAVRYRTERGLPPLTSEDTADMAALASALGLERWVVEDAMARSGDNIDVFMSLLGIDPATMEAALSQVLDPQALATIDAIAYGLAKLLNTPLGQLKADADVYRATQGERQMSAHAYVGADGSYPEVASRAVMEAYQQTPSPIYGYLRTGQQQKIYLFHTLEQGSGWFATIVHGQAQPYDYAAVFAATDLSRPVPNLESFGHTVVSGYTPASDAELVNRATDDQFFAMYPDRHGRRLDPNDPADRALLPVWQHLHQQTAARAQELALAGDTYVGQFWPFLLGLPLGGLAGYFLRRWQEQNPGQALPGVPPGKLPAPNIPPPPPPKTSGNYVGGPWLDIESMVGGPWLDIDEGPMVGGPWLDLEGPSVGGPWLDLEGPSVGGPWLDLISPYDNPWLASAASPSHARFADQWVGTTYGSSPYERPYHAVESDAERRRRWPQTKALIEVAKSEARASNAMYPTAALVWSLDPSGMSTTRAQLTGGLTNVVPFSSYDQALDYMRSRIQTPHIALALFDTASPHWPNPVNWTKSDDPAYEAIIAERISMSSPRMAGAYVGTSIGAAIDDVRSKAESLAARRAENVIGVIHTAKDDRWHVLAFHNADDADDWITTATQDPSAYTYAAYFDKQGVSWPHAYIEKISGMRAPPGTELPRHGTTVGWRHRRGWAA